MKRNLMGSFFALMVLFSAQACFAQNSPSLVKIDKVPNGGQVFRYKNGSSCLRRDDYEKTVNTCAKLQIKTIFSAAYSYQTKIENVKQLSPDWEMIDDAFFDECSQYGEGVLSLADYRDSRKAYDQLRLEYLKGKISASKAPVAASGDTSGPTNATSNATTGKKSQSNAIHTTPTSSTAQDGTASNTSSAQPKPETGTAGSGCVDSPTSSTKATPAASTSNPGTTNKKSEGKKPSSSQPPNNN